MNILPGKWGIFFIFPDQNPYNTMAKTQPYIWIWPLLFLLIPGWASAQDTVIPQATDTLQLDILEQMEVLLPQAVISDTISVIRYGLDREIDQGFAPIGNGVASFIFYAPTIGKDVVYSQPDSSRSARAFYQQPPFTVWIDKSSTLPIGKGIRVEAAPEGGWLVFYPKTVEIPFDQPVLVENLTLTARKSAVNAAATELPVQVTVDGLSDMVSGFAFSLPPLSRKGDLNSVEKAQLDYYSAMRVNAGDTVVLDGFRFALIPNPASAYQMAPGKVYEFHVVNVTFLPIVVLLLIVAALFFTVYFKFINITKFGLALNVVRGAYTNPKEAGEVSHFQALTAALSGTVGLGNIAGVAIAITIGGPGATFWMIVAGLLGMSTKFIECTLGVAYRLIDKRGVVSGGPMYYLSQGLAEKGWGGLGKFFAIFFAIMAIGGSFGGGNMFQVNQAYHQFTSLEFVEGTWIAENGWAFGVIVALLVGVVIIGGIQSIAKVTDKMVPFMVAVYLLAGIVILGLNYDMIPNTLYEIFTGAFSPIAVAGGFVGVLIQGFRRAAFSNEAGVGSASIAHSAVRTNNPASEGIVALLEPFIDTVVVCTMTAIVIIVTGNHLETGVADGVALTSKAFSSELPFFKYILALAVLLFAFSTMISWSYYGLKAWTYLFGNNPVQEIVYKVIFCLVIIVGAAGSLDSIVGFSDAMIFAMAVPNLIGLFILAPKVRVFLNDYLGKIKSGEIARVK